jgi:hypothetical protein
VIAGLQADHRRTFTHYEIKYFSNWFERQQRGMREIIQSLLSKGQLEFVTGGWDMHDEACPTYQDILLNL